MLVGRKRRHYPAGMDWTLSTLFRPPALRTEVALASGCLFRVVHAKGRRLTCLRGSVWVTAVGDPDDIFLKSGDRWTIPNDGLVLVGAEDSAVVTLDC